MLGVFPTSIALFIHPTNLHHPCCLATLASAAPLSLFLLMRPLPRCRPPALCCSLGSSLRPPNYHLHRRAVAPASVFSLRRLHGARHLLRQRDSTKCAVSPPKFLPGCRVWVATAHIQKCAFDSLFADNSLSWPACWTFCLAILSPGAPLLVKSAGFFCWRGACVDFVFVDHRFGYCRKGLWVLSNAVFVEICRIPLVGLAEVGAPLRSRP